MSGERVDTLAAQLSVAVPRRAGTPRGLPDGGETATVATEDAAIGGEQPDGLPTFADGVRSARLVDAVVHSSATATWTQV